MPRDWDGARVDLDCECAVCDLRADGRRGLERHGRVRSARSTTCAPAGAAFTAITPGRGSVIAESCYASEGAGYGSWAHTANNRFAATFIGNSFGPAGTVAATYKVRASVVLGPSGDTFSGPFT